MKNGSNRNKELIAFFETAKTDFFFLDFKSHGIKSKIHFEDVIIVIWTRKKRKHDHAKIFCNLKKIVSFATKIITISFTYFNFSILDRIVNENLHTSGNFPYLFAVARPNSCGPSAVLH